MNEVLSTVHGQVSVARRVDQVCDQFEAACKAGPLPRVEEYVEGTPPRERWALLRELIPLEVDYRLRSGARPTAAEYLLRFPDVPDLIQAVFREAAPPPGPDISTGPPESRPTSILEEMGAGPRATGRGASSGADLSAIAGHEILGLLGRGAMGVVYKARQVELNRVVALKMILAGAQAAPEQLARFLAEARAVASLQHPNIVQIYTIGEHNGLPFIALEFVDGGSLADRLKGTRLSPREASELVETLAGAVHTAHQRGIIHRDLKPANVLLTADGFPKVADFGLAKFVGAETLHPQEAGRTQSGAIVGTPSYMAPEQASGQSREIGPAADVYALGAILYECLTGRPPFRSSSILETLEQVRSQEPLPPRRLQPRLSRDLETICLKCLRKDPSQRYASGQELADDLRRFINYEPITARPTPPWRRLLERARRRPALTALGIVLVAVLLGGLGLIRWSMVQAETERANRARSSQERRQEFLNLVEQGQDSVGQGDWQHTELHWQRALDKVGPEPAEPDLAAQAEQVRADLDQLRRARASYRQFCRCRDAALFHETLLLGLGAASHREKTESAAREALHLFGVDGTAGTGPVLPAAYLSEGEGREIEEGCYQLLLVLAEVVASGRPGQDPAEQAAQALRILDGAAGLARRSRVDHLRHGPDRAYHLRRARYLEQSGDELAALRERDLAAQCQPDSALDFFLMGHEYLHRGKDSLEQAVGEFEKALQRQPDHFWAQYYLAICYLQLPRPRPDLARAHLTACLSRRPDFPWVRLLRGFAHSELGAFAAAAADYQQVEDGTTDEDVRYALLVHRGVLRLRQAEAATDSAGALRCAAALAPAFYQPQLGVVQLCRQRWLDEAIADFKHARALQPGECMAYVNLARAYRKEQKPAEALAQLDQAIDRAPEQAALYRERAQVHLQRQDVEAARWDFEEALRREPPGSPSRTRAANLVELGRILYRGRHAYEVVQVCDAALAAWPDHPAALRLRAQALLQLERYQEAVESLDRYEQTSQPAAEVYRARGLARAKLGQYAGAIADYSRALDREPDPSLWAARGWIYLLVYEAPRLALADFEEALGRDPNNSDAYNGRGYARVLLGQARAGVADANEALRRGPEDVRLCYNAARIFAQAAALEEVRERRSPPYGVEKSRDWQARAIQLLHKALDLCPARQRSSFWRDYVRADAVWQPLRRSTAFAELAAEFSQEAR